MVRTNAGNAEEPAVRDDVSETSDPFYQMCNKRTLSALLLHGRTTGKTNVERFAAMRTNNNLNINSDAIEIEQFFQI